MTALRRRGIYAKEETETRTTFKISTSSVKAVDLLRILPFLSAIVVYFYYCKPHISKPTPCLATTVAKCLPIIFLTVFVDTTSGRTLDYKFKKYVFFGLIGCCVGDACLVYPEGFIPGMLAFAIGHGFYIKAFAYQDILKLDMDIGTIFPIIMAIVTYGILFPGMSNLMRVLAGVYLTLLCYMVIQATNRMKLLRSVSSFTAFLGAWLFGLSDLALGVAMWVTHFQGDSLVVMTLYYIGQFLIAISVLGF
ncbi:lysoplasmalogenase TMEM86A-like [Lineus longissimus]|uniref:lysoplasmalogenase TMEM86A-like n=1 Tax=Lineus longissimus TaxID=88925 RepID=UPI002B4F839A